jgi:hypothetical protein
MPRAFLDRGQPLEGIERTARDARIPYQLPRSLKNFQLPDKRLLRRPGFRDHMASKSVSVLSDQIIKQTLAKHTGSTLSGRQLDDPQFKTDIFRLELWVVKLPP